MIRRNGVRRLLERASRHLSFVRRLPRRFGRVALRVSPGAALCYYRRLDGPAWRELFDFAENCVPRDAIAWDIGASMGVFSFAAAHMAGPRGRVLAVEADTWAAGLIKSSAASPRPGSAPVQVLCAAVAENAGIAALDIPERGRAGSHLAGTEGAGSDLLGGVRETHPVTTVTLDSLLGQFGPPSAIKLDIEGAELAALTGAHRILSESRPALLVEVYERHADAVTRLLHESGYELFDLSRGWNDRRRIARAAYNTLALAH